jgi:hypothetical protein
MRSKIIGLFFLGASLMAFPGTRFELKLSEQLSLGKKEILFQEIASVCEDDRENFYVLDRKAFKVYKFSKDGKRLYAFGNRGDGPADFLTPHSVSFTPEGNIVINESREFVSLFDDQGRFLKRIKVPKGLGLYFLKNDLFFGWIWTPAGKQQVLLNRDGEIIKRFFSISRNSFSINAADETGRMVMFNSFREEYTPFFLFSQYKSCAVIGVTDKYDVLLMKDGKITGKIARDIKPGLISTDEREHFKHIIKTDHRLPDFAKKEFVKRIPRYKNYFNHLLISDQWVWIFRIKEDITDDKALIPVDLYGIDTTFKGKLFIRKLPYFVSKKYIYFVDTDDEDDLILTKYSYTFVK